MSESIPLHRFSEELMPILGEGQLIVNGHTKTKKKLHEESNQLARFLQKSGVSQGEFVGVCLERSFELVMTLFAIFKVGGIYLPLDPDYPQERMDYILRETNPVITVTQNLLSKKFSHSKSPIIVCDKREFAYESRLPLEKRVKLDETAYVLFTSGSTGKPKGVAISHRGLLNRLLWMKNHYELSSTDVILQKTASTFDVSLWELLLPFITPANLVIVSKKVASDPDALVKVIQKESISMIHFVPSMLKEFLHFLEPKQRESCYSLRYVISSGEPLLLSIQTLFYEKLDAHLHNLYGPTEA